MAIELTPADGITAESRDIAGYDRVVANAVILTKDNCILLQRRGLDDRSYPDALALFGGGVEAGETVAEALCRELHEEIEAKAKPQQIVLLGANTFERNRMRPLVITFFWHDNDGTIGACHEDRPERFDSAAQTMTEQNCHPVLHWALQECGRRGLIPA